MENRNTYQVLTERAFAQAVGLSYAKVKELRRQGLIKHCRVGRRVLYRREHVDIFLKQFEQAV
jgi:excisionase family DNA binding protein